MTADLAEVIEMTVVGERMAIMERADRPGQTDDDHNRGAQQRFHPPGVGDSNRPRLSTASLPIRGRTEHTALISGLIADLRRGGGSVLLIEGPPGIGKSRLVDEVEARATQVGARTLKGRACEDQQAVPFAPLFEAIVHASPPICDAAALRDLGSRADHRYWAFRDLLEAIDSAATNAPISISIDDIHWADAGTIVALRALVAGLVRAPVLWTLAMRSVGGRPEVRDAIGAVTAARANSAHHIRLGALDFEAVAQIAGDVLGARPDESVLQLANMAHGNPFLVLELLRGLHEENRIDVGQGRASATGHNLPHRLAETMQRRLDRLSSTARHTVQVASVLPEGFSVTLLARTLGQGPSRMIADVDEAIRADLLIEDRDQLRFRHDLLRQATRQTIPHAFRRAMERESAGILLELGAAPEEVATLLARSAEMGDLAAVTSLRQAADSLSRSDPSAAAELSQRALNLLRPDDGDRAAVVAETVVLLNQASSYAEAEQLAAATLSSELPEEEEAKIRLSLSIASSMWPGRRAEQNRLALQMQGVSAQTRARHLGWLAYNSVIDGLTHPVRDAARAALGLAEEAGDLQARLIAEIALASVDCAEGHQRRCMRRIEALQPQLWHAEGGVVGMVVAAGRANLLVTMGRLADATEAISDGLKNARRLKSSAGEQVFVLMQALCDLAAGRLISARSIVESLPEGERLRADLAVGRMGLLLMGAIAAHTDDRLLLRQVGIAARAALDGGPAVRREALAALAHSAWQRGDNMEAARWLGEDVDLLTTPVWAMDTDHVVLAARVARTSSDAGLRQRVLSAVEIFERDGRTGSLFSAVARHARGLLENDLDAIEEAVRSLAKSARPLLHAGAAEDLGHALARIGNRDRAVEQLCLAFDIYCAHKCSADAHRIARALHSLGVHRRIVRHRDQTGWDSLTASELRVVELVADGATNQEAARGLGVSPHTVSTHVRSVFTKLGIHSRVELRRLVRGGHELAADGRGA